MTTDERLAAIEGRVAELCRFARMADSLAGSLNARLDTQNANLDKLIRILQGKDEEWSQPWLNPPEDDE